jgi:hypothetical protein
MRKCHCRDYQQATGSACAALMVVPKEAFQSFTSGLGLGRVKTLWQKTACSFRAPNPFTITGKRGLADRPWDEASIVSEARIRRVTGLMTGAQPRP